MVTKRAIRITKKNIFFNPKKRSRRYAQIPAPIIIPRRVFFVRQAKRENPDRKIRKKKASWVGS